MTSVLVIDDDPVTRWVTRSILERAGYTVSEADNGRAGLAAIYLNPPDLVITDIFMPQKDGIETICELQVTRPELKIIALSGDVGFADRNMLDMAKLLGADEVIGKPFRDEELLSVVDRALAHPPRIAGTGGAVQGPAHG